MEVKILFQKEIKKVSIENGLKAEDAVRRAGINPETVVISRNGEIITEDEIVHDNDELEIIRIVSGG